MITSIITALYLLNVIPPQSAYEFLYVCGFLLIAGELVFGGHGLIALNGLFAFFIGYAIQQGNVELFGIHIDWSVLFGLALVEALILVASVIIYLRYRKIKSITGKETMLGKKAAVIKWKGTSGLVKIEGETWKAASGATRELAAGAEVTVSGIDGLTLKIQ